jgi:hypothetical protein
VVFVIAHVLASENNLLYSNESLEKKKVMTGFRKYVLQQLKPSAVQFDAVNR